MQPASWPALGPTGCRRELDSEPCHQMVHHMCLCRFGGYGPFSVQRGARVIELRMGEDTAHRCACA